MIDDHFFRREHARIVAALVRVLGDVALAEDVAHDAYIRALEVWKVQGLPDNPAAWITTVAKRRAIDVLRRSRPIPIEEQTIELAFDGSAIRDEQLRMMFACCAPELAQPVHVTLILNLLCGFGAPEIAAALLETRAAVEKRITRGKRDLAANRDWLDVANASLPARTPTVQRALYLLFSEGYHGSDAIRTELCDEAVRLVRLLADARPEPSTFALAALMCLHAARLPARTELCAFADQDRSLWDRALVAEGLAYFDRAATGTELSAYHVEAAIAVTHASAPSVADTDWPAIAALYDRLHALAPSPVVALNRAIAIGQTDAAAGLVAIRRIAPIINYPFQPAAEAELHVRLGDRAAALVAFNRAFALARNHAERQYLANRIAAI
ncbi:MAG: sigma factor [Kofleriaceae bacterium]